MPHELTPLPKLGGNFRHFHDEVKDALELRGWVMYIQMPFMSLVALLQEWTASAVGLPCSVAKHHRISSENVASSHKKPASGLLDRFKLFVAHRRNSDSFEDIVQRSAARHNVVKTMAEKAWEETRQFEPKNAYEERLQCEEHLVTRLLRSAVRNQTESQADSQKSAFGIWITLVFFHTITEGRPVDLLSQMVSATPADFSSIAAYCNLREKQQKLKFFGRDVENNLLVDILGRKLHPRLKEAMHRELSANENVNLDSLVVLLDEIKAIYQPTTSLSVIRQGGSEQNLLFTAESETIARPRLCFWCRKPGHVVAACKKRKMDEDKRRLSQQPPAKRGQFRHFPTKRFQANKQNINFPKQNQVTAAEEAPQNEFVCLAAALCVQSRETTWILDSGTTRHMTCNIAILKNQQRLDNPIGIAMADSQQLKATVCGDVLLQADNGRHLRLVDVLCVPELKFNLFSASAAVSKGYSVYINNNLATIELDGDIIMTGILRNGLIELEFETRSDEPTGFVLAASESTWHKRLAHPAMDTVRRTVKGENIGADAAAKCEICVQCNRKALPFQSKVHRPTNRGELLHIDTWTATVTGTNGVKYAMIIIDDFSGFMWGSLLRTRDEATRFILNLITLVERQYDAQVKRLRMDRAGEFCCKEFQAQLEELGIVQELTTTECHASNGKAERCLQTLAQMTRALLVEAKLTPRLWGEAWSTAVHLHNRITRQSRDCSPFEKLNGGPPNLEFLRVFGVQVFIKQTEREMNKLRPRFEPALLTGFGRYDGEYIVLTTKGQLKRARHIIFNEATRASETEEFKSLRCNYSQNVHQDGLWEQECCSDNYVVDVNIELDEATNAAVTETSEEDDLPEVRKALDGPEKIKWRESMLAELIA